jgi:hypothetical protein
MGTRRRDQSRTPNVKIVGGPNGAARLLGVNASTLRNRMKRLGIPYGRRAEPR